jgi:hypothetical protein
MAKATGVFKTLSYKRESTYGTVPTNSGWQTLRRVSSTISLAKDTYQSGEIRTDQQINDFRHGVRRVRGDISGEMSAGTYSDLFAALLRREFTAGASATSLSITIAAGSGSTYTVTRASGSWITDGFKLFDVFRLTAGSFTAGNLNKNLMITALTATVATVIVLNGSALTAEGPIASATAAITGKKTYVPASSHTSISYAMERWFSDVAQSEVFSGVKLEKCDIALPPTGMTTVTFGAMGQNITTATSQYASSPTAATSTGVMAAVNGVLLVGGTAQTIVTGLQMSIAANLSGDPVVGSNTVATIFPGRLVVTGQFTAYFEDATLRDLFINETESSLAVALTADNTAASAFVTLVLPRIKVGSADKADGEGGIVQTFTFQALYNSTASTTADVTTLGMQDSAA